MLKPNNKTICERSFGKQIWPIVRNEQLPHLRLIYSNSIRQSTVVLCGMLQRAKILIAFKDTYLEFFL